MSDASPPAFVLGEPPCAVAQSMDLIGHFDGAPLATKEVAADLAAAVLGRNWGLCTDCPPQSKLAPTVETLEGSHNEEVSAFDELGRT